MSTVSVSTAIRNGTVDPGFAQTEFSNRYIGSGRVCVNRLIGQGQTLDAYGRTVDPGTINTFLPGCHSANYMLDRENLNTRQYWLSSLSPDALQALGETVNPALPNHNYSSTTDLLGVHRDRAIMDPLKVQWSASDQANFGSELDMACRASKKGLQRPTICPSD